MDVEGLPYGRGGPAHIMKGSPQGSGGLATCTLRARHMDVEGSPCCHGGLATRDLELEDPGGLATCA